MGPHRYGILSLVLLGSWAAAIAGAQENRPRLDLYGDALPAGALARLGSMRLRHPNPVPHSKQSDLHVSADGKRLVSRGEDGVRIWDAATGKLLWAIQGDALPTCVAVSQVGTVMATGTGRGKIHVWDLIQGRKLKTLDKNSITIDTLAFSPDGKWLAASDFIVINLWDWNAQQLTRSFEERHLLTSLAFSGDSKTLVAASLDHIYFWDTASGASLGHKAPPKDEGGPVTMEGAEVSKDGKYLAVKGFGNRAYLYKVEANSRKLVPLGSYRLLRFAPDGRFAAVPTMQHIQDVPEIMVAEVGGKATRWKTPGHWARALAVFPDGKTVASVNYEGAICLWDVATGKERLLRPGHEESPRQAFFAPNGRTVYSSGFRTIWQWDADSGKLLRKLERPGTLLASREGNILAYGSTNEVCRVWEVRTGKEIAKFAARRPHGVRTLAVSPDGKIAACGGQNDEFILKDLSTGKDIPLDNKEILQEIDCLAFAPDSKILAAAGDGGGPLWLLDAGIGKALRSITMPKDFERDCETGVRVLAFSPNGKWLAVGLRRQPSRLIAVSHEQELFSLPADLTAFAFSADGLLLAGGDHQGRVYLWDMASGGELRWSGHQSEIRSLTFSPQGDRLLSSSGDGTALIWNLKPPAGYADPLRAVQHAVKGEHLEQWWNDLADKDARKAFRALWTLAALPDQVLPFLQPRLQPVAPPSEERLAQMVKDLGSTRFQERQAATQELENLKGTGEGYLRKVLAQRPPLEVERRLQGILKKWAEQPLTGAELRRLRAWQLLAALDQPAGWALVEKAAQEPSSRPDSEAARALWAQRKRTLAVVWQPGSASPLQINQGLDAVPLRKFACGDNKVEVRALAFSPRGDLLAAAAADGKVRLWDVATGKEIKTFPGGFFSVAFSPDGKVLAWGTEQGRVELWDLRRQQALKPLLGHKDMVMAVAFSADGKHLVSGSWDGTLRLWDWGRGETVRIFDNEEDPVATLALSADGTRLYSGGATTNQLISMTVLESARIRVFDVARGKRMQKWNGRAGELALTPDGQTLVSGALVTHFEKPAPRGTSVVFGDISVDSQVWVHLWDTASGNRRLGLMDHGHGIALSPDGQWFAMFPGASRPLGTGGVIDGNNRVGGTARIGLPVGKLQGVRFSWTANETFRLLEIATGKDIAVLPGGVTAAAFSPDGKSVAVASPQGEIVLWDLSAAGKVRALHADDFGPRELEQLWTELAGEPRQAFLAVQTLAALGDRAAAFLKTKILVPPEPNSRRLALLVDYLADEQPVVRDLAQAELEQGGVACLPLLRQHLKEVPEAARGRLQGVVDKLANKEATDPERLRRRRALQVVEQIGSAASLDLLASWSSGPAHTRFSQDARAARERVQQRR